MDGQKQKGNKCIYMDGWVAEKSKRMRKRYEREKGGYERMNEGRSEGQIGIKRRGIKACVRMVGWA